MVQRNKKTAPWKLTLRNVYSRPRIKEQMFTVLVKQSQRGGIKNCRVVAPK